MEVKCKGQAGQDYFVIKMLKEKRNGTFLEIGSRDPIDINNTYLLETSLGWRGIMVEWDAYHLPKYKAVRPKSYYIIDDATQVDYLEHFQAFNMPKDVDYLQIDLEVNNRSTLTTLENVETQLMKNGYRFATVTFEHDIYTGDHFDTRATSRAIFERNGYVRVFSDVQNPPENGKTYPFEDWYVHPDLVDMEYVNRVKREDSMISRDLLALL